MNIRKMLFIAALMLAFTILLPVAHADDWNQATRVTFSQSVQIPGPQAIVDWFYVGETEGHEFFYPKQEEQELAHATRKTFVSGD